jgi:ABC-type multidrug transport system fused ATPase/permease subunit
LDEPTAALDPIAESEVYEQFHSLSKDKTSLYISHRLASTRFCDRIAFIKDGVVAELGSHDELIKHNGSYAEMFNIQSHYYKTDICANSDAEQLDFMPVNEITETDGGESHA